MNLKNLITEVFERTSKTSDVCRQMSLIGILMVFSLRITGMGPNATSTVALKFFIVSMLLDLFQYGFLSHVWSQFFQEKERELGRTSTKDFGLPTWPSRYAYRIFLLKLGATVAGYGFILAKML